MWCQCCFTRVCGCGGVLGLVGFSIRGKPPPKSSSRISAPPSPTSTSRLTPHPSHPHTHLTGTTLKAIWTQYGGLQRVLVNLPAVKTRSNQGGKPHDKPRDPHPFLNPLPPSVLYTPPHVQSPPQREMYKPVLLFLAAAFTGTQAFFAVSPAQVQREGGREGWKEKRSRSTTHGELSSITKAKQSKATHCPFFPSLSLYHRWQRRQPEGQGRCE